MDLPDGIARLIADLEELGFAVVEAEDGKWPGGPYIELARKRARGVRGVRMTVDRGMWEVEIRLGAPWSPDRRWHEPFMALRAAEGRPRQRRALSHAERRAATLDAVRRLKGTRRERRRITRAEHELTRAYNRWAQGKGPQP